MAPPLERLREKNLHPGHGLRERHGAGPEDRDVRVVVPPGVQSVGFGAFDQTSITSVTLNEGLVTIGNVAFRSSTLAGTVTLPSTVQTIGDGAFGYTRLT